MINNIIKKVLFVFLTFCFLSFFIITNALGDIGKLVKTAILYTEDSTTDLKLYFFPLGNKQTNYYVPGDCCIITFGDKQILVDCGANTASREIINERISEILQPDDLVWDYIIISHRDGDHHDALFSTSDQSHDTGTSKFVYDYITTENVPENSKRTIGTFIDFDVTKCESFNNTELKNLWEKEYSDNCSNYIKKRDKYIKDGSISNYYSALECSTNNISFNLGNNAKIEILYNYYYDHLVSTDGQITSVDVNNQSVCFLLTYKTQKFLFTGDLEEFDSSKSYKSVEGESYLLKNNELLKKGVDFFKAGHHGSKSSNSEKFIDAIKPKYVVITACAGGKHDFPRQESIDNFLKYTDKIYIPSKVDGNKTSVYYGDICVYSDGKEISVRTTDETKSKPTDSDYGEPKPITSTTWLLNNLDTKLSIYTFDIDTNTNSFGHSTLIKYGSIDILIDCGVQSDSRTSDINSMELVKNIENYCIDGVIEYAIVTHAHTESISHFIGKYKNGKNSNDGIFGKFTIETLVDFRARNTNLSSSANNGWLSHYKEVRSELISTSKIKEHKNRSDGYSFNIIGSQFVLKIFNAKQRSCTDEDSYSLVPLISFYGKKILYTGDISNSDDNHSILLNEIGNEIGNIDVLIDNGLADYTTPINTNFLKTVKPKYTIINAPLRSNSAYDSYIQCAYSQDNKRYIYPMSEITEDNKKEMICGNMTIKISRKENDISVKGAKTTILLEKTQWYEKRIKKNG